MTDKSIVLQKFHAPQTAGEIQDQVQRIQEVMRGVMKKKTHYDVIPGTGNKPSLLKPGAEMLLTTFRISVQPEIIDLSADGEVRYQVRAHGIHMGTQLTVGIGVGECSSQEEKYAWRAAICLEEYEDTDPARRRVKYKKGYQNQPVEKIQQVRTSPSDVANTVVKMAKKRAEVDLCLTALACSDIFTQDLEDAPGDPAPVNHPKANQAAPQRQQRSEGGDGKATQNQINMIRAKSKGAPFTEAQMVAAFELDILENLPFSRVNEVLSWIDNGGQFNATQ